MLIDAVLPAPSRSDASIPLAWVKRNKPSWIGVGSASSGTLPFGGFGSAQIKRVVPGNTRTDDNTTLIEFGANLNLPITLGHFQFGPQIGYLVIDARDNIEDAATNDDIDYDFGKGNFTVSGFIGYRF